MNSHDRRTTDRYWPHCISVSHNDDRHYEIIEWVTKNFGSCSFKRRRPPRWCWRPEYSTEEFSSWSYEWIGTQIFFRKKEDYAWFLLKWKVQ